MFDYSKIRIISAATIADTISKLCIRACCDLPVELVNALTSARDKETNPVARDIFEKLIENQRLARELQRPCCQDTGLAVVFADIGNDVHIDGDITEAVNLGVSNAYTSAFLRKSSLSAIDRLNTGDNTPAVLHVRIVPGDKLTLTVAPKGFGSENMSKIAMLKPSDGLDGIMDFVVNTVKLAGPNACPPVVVGVGIGGTFEACALLAKRQLLRPLALPSPDPQIAKIENRLLDRINSLNIGCMGLGGDTTALAVHAAQMPTHLAGLPVAVNMQCHSCRHAEAVI